MAKENKAAQNPLTTDTLDVQGHFEEMGEKAKKAKVNGTDAPKVNLTERIKIKFKKNYGHNKAGSVISVSKVAFDLYDKAGVIEKL